MENRYQFHREPTPKGLLTRVVRKLPDGKRERLSIGYNLTEAEEIQYAGERLGTGVILPATKLSGASPLSAMEEIYTDHLKLAKRVDMQRGLQAFRQHICRHLTKPMQELEMGDGVHYILNRREEWTGRHADDYTKEKPTFTHVSDGTIERECGILMRVLNLAVQYKCLPSNPLTGLQIPEFGQRDRILTLEELHAIREVCVPDVWRAVLVGLTTGLRQELLVSIRAEDISSDSLRLPASTTAKSNLKLVPLNRLACAALRGTVPLVSGRVFPWPTGNALGKLWKKAVRRAARHCPSLLVDPPVFHAIRHTFATRLHEHDVDITVVSYLMGHSLKKAMNAVAKHAGSTAGYTHVWEKKARLAVDLLDDYFAPLHNTLRDPFAHRLPIVPSSENHTNVAN